MNYYVEDYCRYSRFRPNVQGTVFRLQKPTAGAFSDSGETFTRDSGERFRSRFSDYRRPPIRNSNASLHTEIWNHINEEYTNRKIDQCEK